MMRGQSVPSFYREMSLEEKVTALVDSALEAYPELFSTDITVSSDNVIRVVLDGDKGVNIDDCIHISTAVEAPLDAEGYDFSLEVTSYGAAEPFRLERQFKKNAGREVELVTIGGIKHKGLLKGIAEGKVVLETETREPKAVGKGKVTVKKEHYFDVEEVKEAKVIIKF